MASQNIQKRGSRSVWQSCSGHSRKTPVAAIKRIESPKVAVAFVWHPCCLMGFFARAFPLIVANA